MTSLSRRSRSMQKIKNYTLRLAIDLIFRTTLKEISSQID